MSYTFESWFVQQAKEIPIPGARAVLALVGEGGTVPFIARYRKEQTGNLDEVAIQSVIDLKEKWEQILKRQSFILEEIERQKKLTPELKEKISETFSLEILEDLYLPYKQKRKSKATKAKEAGLEPLADWIWNCGHGTETPQEGQTLEIWAFTFRNEKEDVKDAAAAIQGAQDIIVERLSEIQELRHLVRKTVFERGLIQTEKGEKAGANSKYEKYFTFSEPIQTLLLPQNSHRYLAIRRGWLEEELRLAIKGEELDSVLLKAFEHTACTIADSPGATVLIKAARLALKAHVLPSIENEAHQSLKTVADEVAINVFAENVRKLLVASPYGPKAVLGVDPGIRTGCKLAIVDDSGKYIASTVMHTQGKSDQEKAKQALLELVKGGRIRAIAVGNGTAGRETELFIRTCLKDGGVTEIPVVLVNESGASIYSASEVAREEFPELDLTVRGAISIARRFQDPLAELVKIDPKSIGVGQYQHDVSQPALKRSLDQVVDSCVNLVGVNLNTASYHLLSHVAGIGPSLAKTIVEFRNEKGLIKSRPCLLDIPRFSKKVFEQAAGFLRIPDSENPLDNTGVHPERYAILEGLAQKLGKTVKDLVGPGVQLVKSNTELKDQLGAYTFDDIVKELEKPGRDPRQDFTVFQFRDDIHELKDLTVGMICPGIVTNVTNFGAFVDIGVHQDGLVHLSQLSHKYITDSREVANPGDHVKVRVLEVNLEKKQIALSMKITAEKTEREHRAAPKVSKATKGSEKSREPQRTMVAPKPRGPAPVITPPKPQFKNNPFASLSGLVKPSK